MIPISKPVSSPGDSKDSVYLWVHVIIAFIMFPFAILLMRKFSTGLKMTDPDLKVTRTLAIENIPLEHCDIPSLRQYFSECYPHHPVSDIQVAYNVSKLISLTDKLKDTKLSKKYRLDRYW